MPQIEELLTGCLEGSFWHAQGLATKYAGRCIGCGHQVFVKPSAWDVFRSWDHDPKVICELCDRRYPQDAQRVMGIE